MIMISQYEAIKSKNCTIITIDIFDLGRGVLPNVFSFFFLRIEGEKECLIHFFTSRQPPSALNKSTPGWPVEARKMAATKYFFGSVGEVKTKAIIVSWRTSTRSFFCDGEISAGVPTHIITCNCNNWLVYTQILLHPSFLASKPLLRYLSALCWQLSNDFLTIIHDHT